MPCSEVLDFTLWRKGTLLKILKHKNNTSRSVSWNNNSGYEDKMNTVVQARGGEGLTVAVGMRRKSWI